MKKLWRWLKRRSLVARARELAEALEYCEDQRRAFTRDIAALTLEAHAVREQLFWLDSGRVVEVSDGRLMNVPQRARSAGL